MWTGDLYRRLSPSQRAGILAASASVPASLVPLLRPRSATDQGLVTGLSAATSYALTTIAHDAVLSTARGALRVAGIDPDTASTARTTGAIDLTALGVSLGVQAALPRYPTEHLGRAAVRTVAHRVTVAAAAGLLVDGLEVLPGRGTWFGRAIRTVPVVVASGAGIAMGVQLQRNRRLRRAGVEPSNGLRTPLARSLGVGAVTAGGAVALSAVERRIAQVVDTMITRVTGRSGHGSGPSHLASTASIAGALYLVGTRVAQRVELAMSTPDGALAEPPSRPTVSGCPGSAVDWDTLTRDPRRHLVAATTAERIEQVTGRPAQEPIRLCIGLTSAATLAARVELAIGELERTGALDRSLLVLCSPTGTGHVNYAASAAWEYLSGGDCASVTMQYSVRPSVLSLHRVRDGRRQNRAVWAAVAELLAKRRPEDRPTVVLFGESLGAHTSQDAFLGTGTRGLRMWFVDRALWLGTPCASAWARQVRDPARADVHPGEVLSISHADDVDRLVPGVAASARYVLFSHDDDGVAVFSPELLLRSPAWLEEDRSPAVPPQATWSTPMTFLQVAVDAKNAVGNDHTGVHVGGHDYRPEMAKAVSFAFGLPAKPAAVERVRRALVEDEIRRRALWTVTAG